MDTILAFTAKEVRGFKIKKEFEPTEGNVNVERGDIVLLRRTSGNMITNVFTTPKPSYHAGICKGDDQIVHLAEAGGGLFKSHPGNICIQKVNGFTFGKEFRILQKVDGVPDSFDTDVINAMDADDHHDKSTHNCIDFVLKLLKVDPQRYLVQGPEVTAKSKGAAKDTKLINENEKDHLMSQDEKESQDTTASQSQPGASHTKGEDLSLPIVESQEAFPSQPGAPVITAEDEPSPTAKSHETNVSPSITEAPLTKPEV